MRINNIQYLYEKLFVILTTIIFLTTTTISIIYYKGYNFFTQYFSELGLKISSATIFNFGMMTTASMLAILYFLFCHNNKFTKTDFFIATISAIGLFGVGLFPLNNYIIHFISATIFFLFTLILILKSFIEKLKIINKKRTKLKETLMISFELYTIIILTTYIIIKNTFFQKIAVFSIFIWVILYSILKRADN